MTPRFCIWGGYGRTRWVGVEAWEDAAWRVAVTAFGARLLEQQRAWEELARRHGCSLEQVGAALTARRSSGEPLEPLEPLEQFAARLRRSLELMSVPLSEVARRVGRLGL